MDYFFKNINTPVGKLKLVASDKGLVAILWENDKPHRVKLKKLIESLDHSVLLEVEKQLSEYFSRQRKSFDIILDLHGTEFQKSVWQALRTIPYGETRSYMQLAQQIQKPKASRAVGAANGKNPISIIVPCHRVIGANGKLVGFAGGLAVKEKLLSIESL